MKSTWLILVLAIASASAFPYGKNLFPSFRVGPEVCTMLATPPDMKITFSPTVVSKLIKAWDTEYGTKLTVTQPLTSEGNKKIDNLKINLGASLRAMTKTAYIVSGMHTCPCAQKISAAFVKKALSTDCSKKPKICTTAINLVMQANPDRAELYNPALDDVKSKYYTVGGSDKGSCDGENINRDFKQDFKTVSTCVWNFAGAAADTSKQAQGLTAQLASIKPGLLISIVSPKAGVTANSLCYPPGQKTTMSDEFKKIVGAPVPVKAYTEADMGGTLVNQFYKTTTEMPKYAYELQCTDSIDADKTAEGLIKLINTEPDTPTVPTTVSTVSTAAATNATTVKPVTTVKPTTKSNSTTMKPSSMTTKPNSTTTKPDSATTMKATSAKPSTANPASTNAASAATNKATTKAATVAPDSANTATMASTLKPPATDKTTTNPPPTPQTEKEKAFAMVGKAPLGEFFNKSVLTDAQDFLKTTYKYKVEILPPDNSIQTSSGKSFQIVEAKPFKELNGKGPGKLRKKVMILGGNILTASVLGAALAANNGDPVKEVKFEAVADINPDRENGKTKNALEDPSNPCTPDTNNGIHIMSNFRTEWVATTDPCAPKYSGKQAGQAAEVKFMEKFANDRSPDIIISLIYNEDSCAKTQLHYTAANTATVATNFKAGYDGATPTTETITVEKTDYPGNAIRSLSTTNTMVFAICAPKTSSTLQVGALAGKIVAGLSKALA